MLMVREAGSTWELSVLFVQVADPKTALKIKLRKKHSTLGG
jgi:hypothetical protein